MNKPITVTVLPDHLTISVKELPQGELLEKFQQAIPEDVTDEVITIQGREYMHLYGTPEELFKFIWEVTQHFDLLVV